MHGGKVPKICVRSLRPPHTKGIALCVVREVGHTNSNITAKRLVH